MHIKENLSSAAQDLAGVQAAYANRGISLSELALCGAKEFVEWQHYPNNDLVDAISGYEFYYHSHSSDEMPKGEHGHFHLFKRHAKNPEKFHHLIGIALDPKGVPVRIFTTNQWVTGESLLGASTVLRLLKNFNVSAKGRMSPLAKWINAFTKLFYAEMEKLIVERDRVIENLVKKMGSRSVALESKKHHVVTQCKIDLMQGLSKHLSASH